MYVTVEEMCLVSSSLPMSLCCLSACPGLPDIPHAFITEESKKDQYQPGDVIYFTCETGYISGPTIKYACTNKGWEAIRRGKCTCKLTGFLLYSFHSEVAAFVFVPWRY